MVAKYIASPTPRFAFTTFAFAGITGIDVVWDVLG